MRLSPSKSAFDLVARAMVLWEQAIGQPGMASIAFPSRPHENPKVSFDTSEGPCACEKCKGKVSRRTPDSATGNRELSFSR